MPILHEVQASFGYVPRDAMPVIAEALNLSRAEVYGVVELLPRLPQRARRAARREDLPGRGLPVEGLRGAGGARGSAARRGLRHDRARRASRFEAVYCLGLCAIGPSAMVDGAVVARLDAPGLDALLDGARGMIRVFVPRDAAAIACRRGRGGGGDRRGRAAGRGRARDRAQRLARDAVAGAAGRGRDRRGAARVRAARRCGEVEGLMAAVAAGTARRASAGGRAGRGDPVLRGADAADLRALRRDRSGVARRLCGARRLEGAGARDRDRAGGDGRRGDGVGAARARRRRVPDRDQVEDGGGHRGGRRSTSSATPTRATAAPSPTG